MGGVYRWCRSAGSGFSSRVQGLGFYMGGI